MKDIIELEKNPKEILNFIKGDKDKKVVMIGEASHGTSEFYVWRAIITRYLIEERGYNFVAVEGDWPDISKLNNYVKGYDSKFSNAIEVVKSFRRWPTWMWSNWEVVSFIEWLKTYNDKNNNEVGFYGLDVYSLWDSLDQIMNYLKDIDGDLEKFAQKAKSCFEPFQKDSENYARNVNLVREDCQKEVVDLLTKSLELQKDKSMTQLKEKDINLVQNARVLKNAEKYYRNMIGGNKSTWNIRDSHMIETLDELLDYHGEDSKGIVWAHNTHIGDARATDMSNRGLYNIGQLAREKYQDKNVSLVGMGSNYGEVIASRQWGTPFKKMKVPRATKESWEDYFGKNYSQDNLFISKLKKSEFEEVRGHRAIGVVYHPEYEHMGNFVPTNLYGRYDSFLYFEETNALHPIDHEVEENKIPDTYPWNF